MTEIKLHAKLDPFYLSQKVLYGYQIYCLIILDIVRGDYNWIMSDISLSIGLLHVVILEIK